MHWLVYGAPKPERLNFLLSSFLVQLDGPKRTLICIYLIHSYNTWASYQHDDHQQLSTPFAVGGAGQGMMLVGGNLCVSFVVKMLRKAHSLFNVFEPPVFSQFTWDTILRVYIALKYHVSHNVAFVYILNISSEQNNNMYRVF